MFIMPKADCSDFVTVMILAPWQQKPLMFTFAIMMNCDLSI